MAKRGRQKNRTGNSKRPPAPSFGGAAATKLPSVNPGPLAGEAKSGDDKPSAKLQLVPSEPQSTPSEPPVSSSAASDSPAAGNSEAPAALDAAPPSLEAAPLDSPKDGTPSPTSMDLERGPVEEVDEFEEAFFSSLPAPMPVEAHDDHEEADARMARLHAPEVVARRDRMRRLVAWGLAACAAVFFVAVGRAALHANDVEPARVQTAVTPEPPVVAPAPVPVKVDEPVAEVAEPVKAEEPALVASAAASAEPLAQAPVETAAPVAEAPVVAPAPEPAAVASAAAVTPGDGKALRTQAQRLLESGKANDAIAPALEATTVEPEHAGGWLLLGAAYQTRGRNAEARQAFVDCVKTAKRGPRGECAAMLR